MSLKLPVCFKSFFFGYCPSIDDVSCNNEATAHLFSTKPESTMARMAISPRFKFVVKKDTIMITSTIEKLGIDQDSLPVG